jgi:tuftelin-interacting protein 11
MDIDDDDDDEPAPRADPALSAAGVPSSFGASTAFQPKPKPKPSFLRSAPAKPIAPGHGGAFASMMMSRMGWSGGGLGKEGEGIINPIEVQQRPERSGIAFGGFREKTKQAKEEARRRGEAVSEDEEAPKERRRGRDRKEKKESGEIKVQAWQRTERKARKPKVEHRTYEQILEEAGAAPPAGADMGPILDATGAKVVEVSSLSQALAMQGVPSADTTQLPELRHNLRLICTNNSSLLKGLAQEGTRILERRRWLIRERDEAERRRVKISADAQSLRAALALVRQLEGVAADASSLEAFEAVVGKMEQSAQEVEQFGLDEALVGAIAATFKREMQDWQPLEDPKRLTKQLRRWRRVLRIESAEQKREVDAYGNERKAPSNDAARSMRPYEVLLWTLWMPPVRSALNNTWRPSSSSGHTSAAAIALLEAWTPLLPRFIYDNLLDQLLLPKLRAAVAEWEPRSKTPLSTIIFPWLPVLGDRMTEVMEDARRRLRSSLKSWRASDGVPADLSRWQDVYASKDWEAMLLSLVLPKLSAHLKSLRINPAAQDLAPFVAVMQWRTLLRPLNLSRLFEADFFPAWLSTLHLWLTQPGVDFDEVAQWYSFWRAQFPAEVAALPGVKQGFARGLDLVNQAMEAPNAAARTRLPKPDTTPLSRAAFAAASAPAPPPAAAAQSEAVSFRRIVEEAAAAADLLVLPLDKSHPTNGLPLFRIARGMDKGGVVFYLDDDVVWSREGEDWEPLALDDLVKKAQGGKR